MRHPLFLPLTLLGTFTLAGVAVQAQGFGPGHGHRRGWVCYQGRGRGLNLTEAQRTQIKALREQHQAALRTKSEAGEAARRALREALLKPETELTALKGLHEKVAAAQFELLLERRSLRLAILPILTPEQKTLLEQGLERGFGPRGRRGGAPHPVPGPQAS